MGSGWGENIMSNFHGESLVKERLGAHEYTSQQQPYLVQYQQDAKCFDILTPINIKEE